MRPLIVLLVLAVPVFAAPVPKSVKKPPLTSPDGAWRLLKFSSDGAEPALPQSMALDWVIEGDFINPSSRAAWAAQPKGTPNFTRPDPEKPNLRKWGVCPAVYEVDGDTLRCCYAHDGRKELTECKPAQGIHYYVFERVKE